MLTALMVSGTKMAIGDAGITALLGYAVVFVGLVLLMVVTIIFGKIMVAAKKKKAAPAAPAAEAPAEKKKGPVAPGSAGELKLYNVSDRDAAMIMAIVADKMGKPLNELRFKSIKEIENDEI